MRNGNPHFSLLSGYIGSLHFGLILVWLAFDERSSKIIYLIHSPLWLLVIWFAVGFFPKIQIVLAVGGTIALWFGESTSCKEEMVLIISLIDPAPPSPAFCGRLLRFYILFLGLMSLFYPLWDCLDE